jgi:hypothetical protein
LEVTAGAGPVSFTAMPERLLLTPWDEATLTLPEMDAVEACGVASPSPAKPGTVLKTTERIATAKTIHRARFSLLSNIFSNTLPNLVLAISRSSILNMEFTGDWNFVTTRG